MMMVMSHKMLADVDNWDLSVHHRETTRVQNRRNVQVGSLENQPKPRTGKDGFLCHARLGLVGWISYWCLGDSALAVIILVALIQTSSKEETHVRPGHHWLLKFGKVAGSDSYVEKEFILGPRKFEEYKGCCF